MKSNKDVENLVSDLQDTSQVIRDGISQLNVGLNQMLSCMEKTEHLLENTSETLQLSNILTFLFTTLSIYCVELDASMKKLDIAKSWCQGTVDKLSQTLPTTKSSLSPVTMQSTSNNSTMQTPGELLETLCASTMDQREVGIKRFGGCQKTCSDKG